MKVHNQKEISLRDVLRVIFRNKIIIVACFITIMISVYIGLELRTPEYRSEVKILVSGTMQKDLEVQRSLGPGQLIATQMLLVDSRPILERTVKALKLYQRPLDYEKRYSSRLKQILIEKRVKKLMLDMKEMTAEGKKAFLINYAMGELAQKIQTYPIGETSMFIIEVRDFNPRSAGMIANVLSRSYVIFDLEQQIAELQLTYGNKNETIKKLAKHIEKIEETLDGRILPDIEAIGPASVKIITQAGSGSLVPMRPSKSSGLIAGFIISMVLGVSLAFVFNTFNQAFKSSTEVENYLNIPFLGSIAKRRWKDKLLIEHDKPITRYTQSLLDVTSQIYVSMKEKNVKTLLLSDAEGSIETAAAVANIGIFLSQMTGHKVLIIDADIRSASLSKVLNIANTVGLVEVLERKTLFEDAVQELGTNLMVIPAGNTELHPGALLGSPLMFDVIKKANELYELILINCVNIKNFSDAIILSALVDSFALVINEDKVRRIIVKNAISPFEQKNVPIIGAILNNRKYVIPEIIYRLT